MNDRCAAGTGKFLEVMAHALGYPLETFGEEALKADRPVQVGSVCTVFAESEVISLIAKKEDRRRIALGLHQASARRIAAMASRIGRRRKVLLVGGVARNPCMAAALREELDCEIVVPEHPEFVVALGAAMIAGKGTAK
jgi:predicted CoA-substrate-specific enzyme activase